MKKQTMYNRLQKQYEKLNQSIQKAMKTGRFYAYTQFKQEQLLSRLKRCSFQLKQIGAGVAVVAALGMATPAVGQYPYILTEKTGVDNPLDGEISGLFKPEFVDIDDDGDLDVFVSGYAVNTAIIRFLENTGDSIAPVFTERTGSSNPLDGEINKLGISFVDIDGDGDMDLFAGNQGYYSNMNSFYYENTGDSITPAFTLQPNANNPLDSVRIHLNALNPVTATDLAPRFSFVDIDDDGDMDCFIAVHSYNYGSAAKIWYYENIGTRIAPDFIRKADVDNPFNTVLSYQFFNIHTGIIFVDTDNDGDQDAVLNTGGVRSWVFCANEGTSTSADFDTLAVTPLDGLSIPADYEAVTLVDINNDSKLDVFRLSITTAANPIQFFLNETGTNISHLETKIPTLNTFPNPTSGLLFFDEQVTGLVRVTSITGQEMMNKALFNESQLDLSSIPNGMYTLSIKLKNATVVSKIIFIEN